MANAYATIAAQRRAGHALPDQDGQGRSRRPRLQGQGRPRRRPSTRTSPPTPSTRWSRWSGAAPAQYAQDAGSSGGRQDRHDDQQQGRLVQRVHPAAGHGRRHLPHRQGRHRAVDDRHRRLLGELTGGTVPVRIWTDYMQAALKGRRCSTSRSVRASATTRSTRRRPRRRAPRRPPRPPPRRRPRRRRPRRRRPPTKTEADQATTGPADDHLGRGTTHDLRRPDRDRRRAGPAARGARWLSPAGRSAVTSRPERCPGSPPSCRCSSRRRPPWRCRWRSGRTASRRAGPAPTSSGTPASPTSRRSTSWATSTTAWRAYVGGEGARADHPVLTGAVMAWVGGLVPDGVVPRPDPLVLRALGAARHRARGGRRPPHRRVASPARHRRRPRGAQPGAAAHRDAVARPLRGGPGQRRHLGLEPSPAGRWPACCSVSGVTGAHLPAADPAGAGGARAPQRPARGGAPDPRCGCRCRAPWCCCPSSSG